MEDIAIQKQETRQKYPEQKVIALNVGEINQHKVKFFKGSCKKCGKYGHIASVLWGDKNKVNENKNKVKHRFDG